MYISTFTYVPTFPYVSTFTNVPTYVYILERCMYVLDILLLICSTPEIKWKNEKKAVFYLRKKYDLGTEFHTRAQNILPEYETTTHICTDA
jgi:hypothetical protein